MRILIKAALQSEDCFALAELAQGYFDSLEKCTQERDSAKRENSELHKRIKILTALRYQP